MIEEESQVLLEKLFAGISTGWLEITYLTPFKDHWPKIVVDFYPFPLEQTAWDTIGKRAADANKKGYGINYGLGVRRRKYDPERKISQRTGRPYWHYQRGKADDTILVTALWADVDIPGTEGRQHLTDETIRPSIIVSSGGGWHGLWLLDEPLPITDQNRQQVIRTLKGLALSVHGDLAVADLSRTFRLPGYVNTKPTRNGAVCTVYDAYWLARINTDGEVVSKLSDRVSFEDMKAQYARLAMAHEPPVPSRPLDPKEFAGRLTRRAEDYLAHGAPDKHRNNELLYTACAFKEAGYSLEDTYRALTPVALGTGLDASEVRSTILKGWNRAQERARLDSRRESRMAGTDAVYRNWWEETPAPEGFNG